jgi:hypothetical protein
MSVSVQLYSVRHAIDADLPAAVGRLAEIGFTQAEPYNSSRWRRTSRRRSPPTG